jgi:23S rRNA (uracil1939-C5)-methyltransferase
MPESNEIVTIEKLVYGGAGLARTPERVTMVPFALAGEEVSVAPGKAHAGHREAALLEVLKPSPDRVAAACAVYQSCGGCHYQHLDYPAQVAAKQAILREQLERIGKLTVPVDIGAVSAEPYGYRNRIQLHLERARLGYRAAGSHKLVPIKECPIASPRLNQAISALRERIHHPHFPKFIQEIELFSNEQETQLNIVRSEAGVSKHFFDWMSEVIPGASQPSLDYRVGKDRFAVSYQSFFQVNRFLAGDLARLALAGAEGRRALDLYAGVGLFSLPLARIMPDVTAVEVVRGAARDLADNAKGLPIEVVQRPAEAYLAKLKHTPDFVLADPPRAGLGKPAVADLVRLKPARITIVSCDPATLARDLAGLVAGGYGIEDITLIDMFPQTFHIESVTRLALR